MSSLAQYFNNHTQKKTEKSLVGKSLWSLNKDTQTHTISACVKYNPEESLLRIVPSNFHFKIAHSNITMQFSIERAPVRVLIIYIWSFSRTVQYAYEQWAHVQRHVLESGPIVPMISYGTSVRLARCQSEIELSSSTLFTFWNVKVEVTILGYMVHSNRTKMTCHIKSFAKIHGRWHLILNVHSCSVLQETLTNI